MQAIATNLLGTALRPMKYRLWIRALKRYPDLAREFLIDSIRYARFSNSLGALDGDQLTARITATYHNIEKGLSLKEPRLRFGRDNLQTLLALSREYRSRYGDTDTIIKTVRDVLEEYRAFHAAAACEDYPFASEIAEFCRQTAHLEGVRYGGTRSIARDEILRAVEGVTPEFFLARHSIRQFDDRPVDLAEIEAAVRIAQKAPVVCNRQSGAVIVIADKELILETLKLQGGARGFAPTVDKLIVVTGSLRNFAGAGERNQCFVDGGLFAMSLVLGLHSRGLGACCLHWSRTNEDSERLRSFLDIREDAEIIMLVAVGHLPETLKVPYSIRKENANVQRTITHWRREGAGQGTAEAGPPA